MGCLSFRGHAEVANYDRVSGVSGQKFSDRALPIKMHVLTNSKSLRIDRWPRRFPHNVDRRITEAEVHNVASTEQGGQFDDAVREPVATSVLPDNGLPFAGRHLE